MGGRGEGAWLHEFLILAICKFLFSERNLDIFRLFTAAPVVTGKKSDGVVSSNTSTVHSFLHVLYSLDYYEHKNENGRLNGA